MPPQLPPTGHTVGGSRNDGFMQRKPVDTDVQEAADHNSKYKDYDVRDGVQEKKHREFLSGVGVKFVAKPSKGSFVVMKISLLLHYSAL